MADEKRDIQPAAPVGDEKPAQSVDEATTTPDNKSSESFEIFKNTADGVQFRVVAWPNASMIFLKIIFATGVLSIPSAMYGLGAVGGSLSVVGWGLLNTYFAIVQGNFRNRHAQCHTVVDMAGVVGGPIVKEAIGFLFIVAYVLSAGSGIIGLSTAFNALSEHGACTVWFSFVAMVIIVIAASVRKFEKIGWLSWAGFISIYIAVFIVVVGVTQLDRPAGAPPSGPYELGFSAIAYPTFAVGMTATSTIFISSAGTSAFIPVISEMKSPKDYNKAVYTCMAVVQSSYLAFSLVVYRWAGAWVTTPSLGSAGPLVKKISYGIGLIGLAMSGCLYLHVAAKYVFVRILRNSPHLQQNSAVHWGTWIGTTVTLGAISFILAEAVPIFNYLLALTGSVCFGPIAIILPAWLWLHDHGAWKTGGGVKSVAWAGHWLLILVGAFITVGGTYAVVQLIIDAYASGLIGRAFSCADNSGTVAY